MGVRGLQSYLETHCSSACYNVNLGKLAGDYHKKTGKYPLIVVDGMSCLRKLYQKLVWICGGQWMGYVENIQSFVKNLRSHGINLVFFFDGNTPERKRSTWVNRRIDNLKDVANYFNIIKANKELENGKHFFLPTGLAAFTPLIYKDLLNCEVYTCLDECDKEVAEYAKKHGALGILGQDSDYTIYNTAPYYFSINHLNLETLDTIVYDRGALARVLHLSVDQLPVLSCLIGNDVIPQELLTIFHKQFLKGENVHGRHSSRPPPEILIPKVANFISNQPPVDQLINQLPQLSKAVFREDTMARALGDGIKMYILNLSGEEKYHPIIEDEYENGDIVEKVRMRHMNSELGRHLYTILRGEPYESSTTLEDYSANYQSNALIFRRLRAKIYCILQKSSRKDLSHITEWCMYSGNTLKNCDLIEPEELPGGSPSLQDLWEADQEFKWKTFCDVLHPKLYETRIKTLPKHFIAPVCLLFYLQCSQVRPIFKDWEIGAMVAQFLTPIRKDLNLIRAINLPRIDSRAVHLATIFVKGLVNIYLLLAVCDFPFERKYCVPWEFWDGKVFQHVYLKMKGGTRVEEMMNKDEELFAIYTNLKTLIASHTPNPMIKKTKPESPTASTSSTPKKKLSPSTSEVTATPPHSPIHAPSTLTISKSSAAGGASPNLSPSSSPHRAKKESKSPKKSAT